MTLATLGSRVKQRRIEKGLTIERLSIEAEVPVEDIKQIEEGYFSQVSVLRLQKILDRLGYELCLKDYNPFLTEEDLQEILEEE